MSKLTKLFGGGSGSTESPANGRGGPTRSTLNVTSTSGVRRGSRGRFSRRIRLPNVSSEWSWAATSAVRELLQVRGERRGGREGDPERERVHAVADEVSVFDRRLTGHRDADDEIGLRGQPVHEDFEGGKQRREERRAVRAPTFRISRHNSRSSWDVICRAR